MSTDPKVQRRKAYRSIIIALIGSPLLALMGIILRIPMLTIISIALFIFTYIMYNQFDKHFPPET